MDYVYDNPVGYNTEKNIAAAVGGGEQDWDWRLEVML